MRFCLLGDVRASVGDHAVDLGHVRQRHVLAALLIDANQVVSTDELVDRVWGARRPSHPRDTLYSYVHRLRKTLGADGVHIGRQGGGYLLEVDPLAIDVHRFDALVAKANSSMADEERMGLLEQALGLWAGMALSGLDTPWFNSVRNAWESRRFAAEMDHIDLRLRYGGDAGLVTELARRATEHPLDERIAGQLMLALYRAGRQADALEHYHLLRTRLADELGIDPGVVVQQLHQRILIADPALSAVPGKDPPPRQLPAPPSIFVGRSDELNELVRIVTEASADLVAVICGTAGVGKTALAIHFAHRVADRFPDGQLYLDLRGHSTDPPMAVGEALGKLLRSLGPMSGQSLSDVPEQSAAYRSLLAGKRMLVVLDNARNAEQVTPLLPGTPGCLVVVTSRVSLTTINGSHQFQLDTLAEAQAVALVGRLAGPGRVEAEPAAAAALASWCARLPLALRIIGARLAARASWPLHTLVAQLADEQRRLDELQVADLAVRTSFEISLHALATGENAVDRLAAKAFRFLGVLDWLDMTVPIAAALLDLPQPEARAALERLVDNNLLESSAPGRYTMHDLLRLYARDLGIEAESRYAALLRVLVCYLAVAEHATLLLYPMVSRIPDDPSRVRRIGFAVSTFDEATEWFNWEHANLMAVVRQAADLSGEAAALMVRLTAAVDPPFEFRGYRQDQITVRRLAADTARRIGDSAGEAFALEDLGWAYTQVGNTDDAIDNLKHALAIYQQIGDRVREPICLNYLGFAYRQKGLLHEAISCHEQGVRSSRESGNQRGDAGNLNNLGLVYLRLSRFTEAIACHAKALRIHEAMLDFHSQAIALVNLGWAHHSAGHEDEAVAHFRQSLAIARELGYPYQETQALWGLAETHHTLGNDDEARVCWQTSISILTEIGELTRGEADDLLSQAIPAAPQVIRRNT